MKKEIIYILLGFALWYVLSVTIVAKECEGHFGWGFHSLFPEPMCNVLENKSTLKELEEIPIRDLYIVNY